MEPKWRAWSALHHRTIQHRIHANAPAERLQHVNGTPRERYRPAAEVEVEKAVAGDDPFITRALQELGVR